MAIKLSRSCHLICSVFLIFLFSFSSAHAAGTRSGTDIEMGPAAVYHDQRVDYSNTLSVLVSQDYGMHLATFETHGSVTPGGSFYSQHNITNIGNGSDTYLLSLSGTTADWSATLVKDDNMNGYHEPSETTPVPNPIILAEDASYYLFVVLTAPATGLKEGDVGSTTFHSRGSVDDGGTYVGANGNYYGGPDFDSSFISATATHVDTNPPTISNLTLNDRKRFSMDIISTRVTVKANILDDLPRNVGKIEVRMNGNIMYSGTSGDWKGAYNEDTGDFQVTLATLEAGEYTFVIIAIDKSNNQAEESITPLYIYPPGDVRVIGDPLNYPNPFAPLKGEKTVFAYVLTTDAEIMIFIYNIVGEAVWKRNYPAFDEGGKAGYNEVIWNGRSDFREVLGNGVYFYRIVHKRNIIGKGRCTILD